MQPSLNTWTSVFLIAAAQGLFLSLAIFSRKSKVNHLLAFLILVFSVCLMYYVTYWTGYYTRISIYFGVIQGTTYLMGPLAYFYIRSERNNPVFNPWHFIPFAAYVLFFMTIHYADQPSLKRAVIIQVVIQNLHLITYSLLAIYAAGKRRDYHNGEIKMYRWRKKIALCFSGYSFTFLLYYILVWTHTLKIEYDYMISMTSSFFIYFTGYYGMVHSEVFKLYETGKYEKSSLSVSAAGSVLESIRNYFENEKPYRDCDLKLNLVAGRLALSSHHISQAINELEHVNFSDFVKRYRIDEAKKILSDPDRFDTKIIQVAYECGFNNKTSFHNAFKKLTGTSPSDYRENAMKMYRPARV